MKRIKLFLASSVVEFRDERQELAAFINSLNNIFVKKDIYIEFRICEDLSNAVAVERKQDEYNDVIRDSQYFYLLFGKSAGAYTIEEFDVALEQFQASGAPKISIYFKQLSEEETADRSVTDFMERLDKQLDFYYIMFTQIDSIKLNLLLELSRDLQVNSDIAFRDGRVFVDGEPVLSLEHVPLYGEKKALLAEEPDGNRGIPGTWKAELCQSPGQQK